MSSAAWLIAQLKAYQIVHYPRGNKDTVDTAVYVACLSAHNHLSCLFRLFPFVSPFCSFVHTQTYLINVSQIQPCVLSTSLRVLLLGDLWTKQGCTLSRSLMMRMWWVVLDERPLLYPRPSTEGVGRRWRGAQWTRAEGSCANIANYFILFYFFRTMHGV